MPQNILHRKSSVPCPGHSPAASRLSVITLLFLATLFNPQIGLSRQTLTLAIHPYLSHEELQQRFQPLANYIDKRSGYTVDIRIGTSYQDHIDHIGKDLVDFAYTGPAPYVAVTKAFGPKPLLAGIGINDKSFYQGYFITRAESPIHSLQDLKNASFAFGDPQSTMSHLVPLCMLVEAGISIDDLARFRFAGSHENVAIGVLTGDFDAGAIKEEVYEKYAGTGLRFFARTVPVAPHLFVATHALAPTIRKELQQLLFSLPGNPEGRAAMQAIRKDMTGIIEARDRDYDNLRKMLLKLAHH